MPILALVSEHCEFPDQQVSFYADAAVLRSAHWIGLNQIKPCFPGKNFRPSSLPSGRLAGATYQAVFHVNGETKVLQLQVVVLFQILAAEINFGYKFQTAQCLSFNGQDLRNVRQLAELVRLQNAIPAYPHVTRKYAPNGAEADILLLFVGYHPVLCTSTSCVTLKL